MEVAGRSRPMKKRERREDCTYLLELHPICLPVGLSVSVSYRPSSVGIFGMVLVLSGMGLTNAANSIRSPYLGGI